MLTKPKICLAFTFVLIAVAIFLFSRPSNIEISPDTLLNIEKRGYYISSIGRTYYLLAATLDTPRHFSGSVSTNGTFNDIHNINPEHTPFFILDKSKKELSFDFYSSHIPDGFSFGVANASWLKYDLYIDGKHIPLREIFLGQKRHHPGSNPFELLL